MTAKFEKGFIDLGFETIRGEHPVTPLVVRDTPKTQALVKHLFANGILATGLSYPVVPKGDEEIRFQVSADHTVEGHRHRPRRAQVVRRLSSVRGRTAAPSQVGSRHDDLPPHLGSSFAVTLALLIVALRSPRGPPPAKPRSPVCPKAEPRATAPVAATAPRVPRRRPAFADSRPERGLKLARAFPEIDKAFLDFAQGGNAPGVAWGVVIDGERSCIRGRPACATSPSNVEGHARQRVPHRVDDEELRRVWRS
jgi:hypothetical protein